ncbi:hypothetical protein V475_06380 [Sphingobium baderi LL03]|uniref:Transposase n=1 Tax=Sphingobium baderi LL03 TaxID=1114964 RepID=T0H2B5_9SPHN|nr:hypothetical protein [Sphingobium baderi]EQB06218.1 hypothetical protein L485_00900 [Sphingobium baderi LL03]KMS62793.1 hypothetical protein V475_06380 [Sphingobium baderi LL03]
MNTETALKEAGRKARPNITAREREEIVKMLRALPIAEVKARTRRSYGTLCKIAEASGL